MDFYFNVWIRYHKFISIFDKFGDQKSGKVLPEDVKKDLKNDINNLAVKLDYHLKNSLIDK
jgi:hypothetical protein